MLKPAWAKGNLRASIKPRSDFPCRCPRLALRICAWFALLTDARQPFEVSWKWPGPLSADTHDLRKSSARLADVSSVTVDAAREWVGYRRTEQPTSLQFRNGASISWKENHLRRYYLLSTSYNAYLWWPWTCSCISKRAFPSRCLLFFLHCSLQSMQREYAAIGKRYFLV